MKGASALHVVKDRPGYLRSLGRPDPRVPGKTYLGHLVVDDTRTWREYLDLAILAPTEAVAEGVATNPVTRRDADEQAILDTIRRLADQGSSTVEKSVLAETRGIYAERKTDAITRLVNRGEVLVEGARKAKIYSLPEVPETAEEASS